MALITPSVSRTPVYLFTCLLYLPVLVLVRIGWGFLDGFTYNEGDVRDMVSIPGWGRSSGGGSSILAWKKSHGQRNLAGHKESDMTGHRQHRQVKCYDRHPKTQTQHQYVSGSSNNSLQLFDGQTSTERFWDLGSSHLHAPITQVLSIQPAMRTEPQFTPLHAIFHAPWFSSIFTVTVSIPGINVMWMNECESMSEWMVLGLCPWNKADGRM